MTEAPLFGKSWVKRVMASDKAIQETARVATLCNGRAAFDHLASVYRVPLHLEPIFRAALETRRVITFTTDRTRAIYAAELLPPPLSALRQLLTWLR